MTGRRDASADLTRFVRETLGCGCPDDIVRRARVETVASGDRGLDVGGRLLVRLLPAADLDRLIRDFPATVDSLVRERDSRGFNRLRMVVPHPRPGALGVALETMLELVAPTDDRVHVHVVPPGSIPSALVEGRGARAT